MTSLRTRERLLRRLQADGIQNLYVLDAIREVPRHLFIDEALASRAYEDTALPIGNGQTISQPYIVALMTEALIASGPISKVLEIGTGCGYQSVILARLMQQVYTIERIENLLFQARERFHTLNVRNIHARHGDGFKGWPQEAPFDGIVLTAAPSSIPDALLQQLRSGGRLILPVGGRTGQRLVIIERQGDDFRETELSEVSFVPMLPGLD